ncbi:MAG TPA: helix-turn-helix transcriptional regulator [Steroidobacteraceae bacterium]|jgi:DNA-binding PadR family transcriptional regulator|nr:helix-turn-helix transcriptional regulator [Steroidobacteraceae bacterium]
MITAQELIVEILDAHGREMGGLEIVKASGGHLSRGTIYVHLERLEARGVVVSRAEDYTPPHIGIARRLYKLAPGGHRVPAFGGDMVPA